MVPVGKDQQPHLEITREIARRFNNLFGTDCFPEPQAVLNESPVLPGTDGRKMSKSYNNVISIEDDKDTIVNKVKQMITDPEKIRKTDPGHPDICTVFQLEKPFVDGTYSADIYQRCTEGRIGCVEHKNMLAEIIWDYLRPKQEKYFYYLEHEEQLKKIVDYGDKRAQEVAQKTIEEVMDIIGL
jgi:tryptophanyl-tRNA synthetase